MRFQKLWALLLCATLLIGLGGCTSAGAAESGGNLSLDYVGEESESEAVSEGDGGWIAWLKNALTADRSANAKKNAEKKDSNAAESSAPETVHEFYQQGADEYESGKDASSFPGSVSGPEGQKSGDSRDESKPEETSSSPSPSVDTSEPESAKNTVTITITCHTAVDNNMHLDPKWAGIVPASGIILPVTTFEIEENETVLSVLTRACEKYKIHMEYSGGTGSGAYVEGINNLYEFDGGRWSGWMYCVNGWYPNYGCGVYFLKAGDVIEWNYTCDLGLDLENGDPYGYGKDWKDTHD